MARTAVGTPAPPALPAPPRDGDLLLEVNEISKRFRGTDGDWHNAARKVSFGLHAGETLGVVGESGAGKTTVARITLGLLEPDEGTVRFADQPWSGVAERDRPPLRRRIQMISQDPLGSFDPRFTVDRIILGAVTRTGPGSRRDRRGRVVELLDQVGLPAALLARRPPELSGGQRQRVAIARALAPGPEVLVCDEPVSALDVSIQAQILDLLAATQRDLGLALLFISHDLGVIHHVSDRVLVMRDGQAAETSQVGDVLSALPGPLAMVTR